MRLDAASFCLLDRLTLHILILDPTLAFRASRAMPVACEKMARAAAQRSDQLRRRDPNFILKLRKLASNLSLTYPLTTPL